jgi:DNA-binding response OmpR family regulator
MPKRILVIEDNGPIRRLISTYLRRDGYEVIEAEDGHKGLEIFLAHPTDLVILDMVMPIKDGMETLMDLRVKFPRLGIIAMSGGDGNGPEPYLEIAIRCGASHILPKPFGRHGLIRAVRRTIKSTADF